MGVISLPFVAGESSVSGFDRVGSFSYLSETDRWEWSDAVARMHGYEPGTVAPTTQLILSHKHPDDQPAVSEIIDEVLRHGAAFSSRHRIIDTAGNEHVVVVVGDQLLDGAGRVIGTTGFYVDLSEHFAADVQRSVTEVVTAVEERRDLIQQAIGIIRMAYGVSAERAFEVLKWRSQQTNVKLRVIAEQVVEQLVAQPPGAEVRSHIDRVLLASHERTGRSPLESSVNGRTERPGLG